MGKRMLPIAELNLGFNDAENYKKPENVELFNKIFIESTFLEKIKQPSTYFIVGEKGTGKTAYAVYFVNNFVNDSVGSLEFIRETDYQKFIALKKQNHLGLSDFTSIWKVIIYLIVSEKIAKSESEDSLFKSKKFAVLQKAIDEYYAAAFSPEILQALNFVEKSKMAADIITKHMKMTGEKVKENQFTYGRFQTNLFFIQKHFEDAISSIKLTKNQILFIDGIDIRPRNVPFEEYLECIKGLANAVWSLNNDFFARSQSKKKIKIMLLLRPDIYSLLGLQNQNNKLRDNGVLLNWITTFKDFDRSQLFLLVDRLLNAQQPFYNYPGECWNYYFPYKVLNSATGKITDNAFISFLRFSYYKPRDFVSMLDILRLLYISRNTNSPVQAFRKSDFDALEFRKEYSEYLLSEIKDQILFYYSEEEYQVFYNYFRFLEGKIDFSYAEFLESYNKYIQSLNESSTPLPKYLNNGDVFLQFLYDNNIIAYIEKAGSEAFIRWCFRERSYTNINPKVAKDSRYTIHYGLFKGLNLGKKTTVSSERASTRSQHKKRYGYNRRK